MAGRASSLCDPEQTRLAQLQTGLKAQVHQTLGKEGAIPETKSIWHSGGQRWLDELQMADAFTNRVESLRDLLDVFHREIATLDGLIHRSITANDDLRDGYEAIQAIGGVGRVLAGVFVAEIGRRGSVPRSPPAGIVGRAHPPSSRIGCEDPARADHETGPGLGPLGRYRGRHQQPLRTETLGPEVPGGRAAGDQDRQGRCRTRVAHPGVLRTARRGDPLPAGSSPANGCVMSSGAASQRLVPNGMRPHLGRRLVVSRT